MTTKLRSHYKEKIIPSLMEQFNYKNIHEVPKITKIVINRGLGEASRNSKALENSVKEIALITGQQPVVTKARKSVAGFKIREGEFSVENLAYKTLRNAGILDALSDLRIHQINTDLSN